MSGMNSDQLHRSTLGIYSSLMDEFNPSLQKLVSLGNSYAHAFKALAVTSEAYFSALANIGEKACHTMTSRSLGDVLIQIADNQQRLTSELEGVFRWFSVEVLQQMDNNVRLDKDYILDSREHYEMEVHTQAATMERQLRRGANQDCSEYVQFLRESHGEALTEEERRYRFLAEKHCGLIQCITRLMNKTGGALQQRVDVWTEEAGATRRPAALDNAMKEEEMRRSREEVPLGNAPSRAPSPQGSLSHYRADSAGSGGGGGGGGSGGGGSGGGRAMRARVAHQPAGSNPTLLLFTRGEFITVMVQQPRNGWLYGRTDSSSRPGWFPASYVEAVDEPPTATSSSSASVRSRSSSTSSSHAGAPPPPPPLQALSSYQHSDMQPVSVKRPEPNMENKRSRPHGAPELFPRGTNPFATVKLKPTTTDDRSAPRLYRR